MEINPTRPTGDDAGKQEKPEQTKSRGSGNVYRSSPALAAQLKVQSQLDSSNFDLCGFFKGQMIKVGKEYATVKTNGSGEPTQLRFSESEFNNIFSSLQRFQEEGRDFTPKSGIDVIDRTINSAALAFAQAIIEHEATTTFSNYDRSRFQLLIGSMCSRLPVEKKTINPSTNALFEDQLDKFNAAWDTVRQKIEGLPEDLQPTTRVIRAYDESEFKEYKGPILILLSDTHYSLSEETKAQVNKLQLGQAMSIVEIMDTFSQASFLQEGPNQTSCHAQGVSVDNVDSMKQFAQQGVHCTNIAGHYLSSKLNAPFTIPGIESKSTRVFMQHTVLLYLDALLCQEYVQDEGQQRMSIAKNEIVQRKRMIELMLNEQADHVEAMISDSGKLLSATAKYLGIEHVIEVSDEEIIPGTSFPLPKISGAKTDKNTLKQALLSLRNLTRHVGLYRNEEILDRVRYSGNEIVICPLGSKHIPDIVVKEMLSGNPMPIIILVHEETGEGQKEVISLIRSGFDDVKSQQNTNFGKTAIDFQKKVSQLK